MGCRICGGKAIDAHLIPKAFAKQVKPAPHQRQAIAHPTAERFRTYNHGRFDPDLLCARCDGLLGGHERKALHALNGGRSAAAQTGERLELEISGDDLLLFCASIIWKYAASSGYGLRIGKYEERLRKALFHGEVIPSGVDAFAARIWTGDDQVLYYREPHPLRAYGLHFVRFSVGGFQFHVKLDQRTNPHDPSPAYWLRGKRTATAYVMRFEQSPDWVGIQELRGNTRLQAFLAKNEPDGG